MSLSTYSTMDLDTWIPVEGVLGAVVIGSSNLTVSHVIASGNVTLRASLGSRAVVHDGEVGTLLASAFDHSAIAYQVANCYLWALGSSEVSGVAGRSAHVFADVGSTVSLDSRGRVVECWRGTVIVSGTSDIVGRQQRILDVEILHSQVHSMSRCLSCERRPRHGLKRDRKSVV